MLFWLLAARAAWRLEARPRLAPAALLGLTLGCAAMSKHIAARLLLYIGSPAPRGERLLAPGAHARAQAESRPPPANDPASPPRDKVGRLARCGLHAGQGAAGGTSARRGERSGGSWTHWI
jgi:hypothetical protein